MTDSDIVDMSFTAGPEIVAIPGPSIIPERVLGAMHRAMPDIYAGDLTEVIDEVFDALPAIAGTTSRAFVPIGNGHAGWEMAIANTLSRGDRVLVLDCGRFAGLWGEMAEFNGLRVDIITAEWGCAVDPAAVSASASGRRFSCRSSTTRSGARATMASMSGFFVPPIWTRSGRSQ